MKRTRALFAFALALGFIVSPAFAQTPPAPPAPVVDAALAAQKAAFLALPEGTRKAAQDALVWLGFDNGVNDGDFGKRTRDAILAFQGNVKAPADGALSAPELKALLAAAQKARDGAGFQIVRDPKSGARIGAPLKLMNARAGARLDLASSADADLGALYARLSAPHAHPQDRLQGDQAGRLLRRLGQDGATTFYTRFDKNAAANPPMRGFTFAYPAGCRRLSSTGSRSRSPIRSSRSQRPPQRRPRASSSAPQLPPRRAQVRPRRSPRRPQPRSSSRPARR